MHADEQEKCEVLLLELLHLQGGLDGIFIELVHIISLNHGWTIDGSTELSRLEELLAHADEYAGENDDSILIELPVVVGVVGEGVKAPPYKLEFNLLVTAFPHGFQIRLERWIIIQIEDRLLRLHGEPRPEA